MTATEVSLQGEESAKAAAGKSALHQGKSTRPKAPSKSELKRQRIVDAAAYVFRKRGYAQATLSEIAEIAGTQAGSLYYYFPSRDALVEELLLQSVNRITVAVQKAVEALPRDTSPIEKMKVVVIAHVDTILDISDYYGAFRRIFDQIPDEMRSRFVVAPRAYARFWAELLRDGKAAGEIREDVDLRVLRLLILGSMTWMTQWFSPEGPNTPAELANQLLDIFIRGVAR